MKNVFYLFSLLWLCVACSDKGEALPAGPARPTMNVQDSLAIVAYYHSMKCAEWKGDFHWDLTDYETWGGVTAMLDTVKNEYRITGIEVPMAETYLPAGYCLPAELGKLSELRSLIVWGDGRAEGEFLRSCLTARWRCCISKEKVLPRNPYLKMYFNILFISIPWLIKQKLAA